MVLRAMRSIGTGQGPLSQAAPPQKNMVGAPTPGIGGPLIGPGGIVSPTAMNWSPSILGLPRNGYYGP